MLTVNVCDTEDMKYNFVLTEPFCQKIYESEIWKTWTMENSVRLQLQSLYPIMPKEIFHEYLMVVFKVNEVSFGNPEFVIFIQKQYQAKWGNLLTLKEIASWVPKKFLCNLV
jgi:hypothetical protein